MKYYSLSLILAINLLLIPLVANAQTNSQKCDNAIANVKQQIVSKGVRQVMSQFQAGTANNHHQGNPTDRKDELFLRLASHTQNGNELIYYPRSGQMVENIMNSPVLSKYWADIIVRNCPTIATVMIQQDQSDWANFFAITPNGTTQQRKCSSNYQDIFSWYEQFCP
jgi:hypothetical protein